MTASSLAAGKERKMKHPWEQEKDDYSFAAGNGYPCVMRRGPGGHWCGYVGVPMTHPWHGLGYDALVKVPQEIVGRKIEMDKVGVINLLCADVSKDQIEARLIPIVLAVDVHGGLTYARKNAPHQPDSDFWWFGFDCAHAGDLCPEYRHTEDSVYRDAKYVMAECRSLAKQLGNFEKA